jgi:hypothetical protein
MIHAARGDSRFSVFKTDDDGHDLRTSDGRAGALHAEYMVLEPSTRKVEAAIVTGGVLGEKFVMVPFKAVRFEGSRDIILTDVARDRLADAPEIEKSQLNSSAMLAASEIDHCYSYFGLQRDAIGLSADSAAKGTAKESSEASAERTAGRKRSGSTGGGEPGTEDRSSHNRRSTARTGDRERGDGAGN